MTGVEKYASQLKQFAEVLKHAKRILITAPGVADGDSIGSQLALQRMFSKTHPHLQVRIVNDEPLQDRYTFLPDAESVFTPETFKKAGEEPKFDIGIIVDGGVDRAGRVREWFENCTTTVFIDHHAVSVEFPYTIRMVESEASSTTELIYHMSQSEYFKMSIADSDFCQQLYLGLIFDTGFFRHSNTTPECLELGAKLLRAGFDFTRVGERGMLERTYASLQLMSDTLARAQLCADGQIISSTLSQASLEEFNAVEDDREGIIDQLFLTRGIEVAVLFFELPDGSTKISFRSHGLVDVASFARSITERGGGHRKASGANVSSPMEKTVLDVLKKLEKELSQAKEKQAS